MKGTRSRFLSLAIGVLFTANVGSAQNKPSFTGTWVATTGTSELVIVQDVTQVRVTDARGRVLTYRLDGSESRNETRTVVGEKWTHVSQARWVSSALVITTTTTREAGQRWDWLTIYRRDGEGGLQVTTLDAVTDPGPYLAMSLNTVGYKQKPSASR
jgi:hypothetical protein